MSTLSDITALCKSVVATYTGYAPTGAALPYACHRPLSLDNETEALDGGAIDWDHRTSVYAAGESVEASYNLALLLIQKLQGARVSGTTLSASMGYFGAQVEGHYESQVTVQLNLGELS